MHKITPAVRSKRHIKHPIQEADACWWMHYKALAVQRTNLPEPLHEVHDAGAPGGYRVSEAHSCRFSHSESTARGVTLPRCPLLRWQERRNKCMLYNVALPGRGA